MPHSLLSPLSFGALDLRNRVVMSALTRNRAGEGEAPTKLNVEYYAQRASAGLIITEGTQPSAIGQGYPGTPGLHTAEQVAGWRAVTDAVHAEGGTIFVQLMHSGRISHPDTLGGVQPVGVSAVTAAGEIATPKGQQAFVEPRELTTDEVRATVDDYVASARLAVEAGFDGVELHGANGYLIAQFLATGSNHRTDEYGGSIPGRVRFLAEVAKATVEAIGADRVALRLSPANAFNDIHEDDARETFAAAVEAVEPLGLAYLAVIEPSPEAGFSAIDDARARFTGPLLVNNGFTQGWSFEEAAGLVESGRADAVMFGRRFLANPDLPARIETGEELNEPDAATFYGGGAEGYTDYPALAA